MTDTLPVYEDASGREHRNPWVDVVFIQDIDFLYEEEPDLVTAWDSWDYEAVADYLANWDYGHETDQAHTTDEDPRRAPGIDVAHEFELAPDHLYYLVVNRQLRYVTLYRRPLDWEPFGFAHGGHHTNSGWFCDTCNSPLCDLA
jgi:hypothetical protein